MSKTENLQKEIENINKKIKVLTVQRTLLKNKLENKLLTEQQQETSTQKKSSSFVKE